MTSARPAPEPGALAIHRSLSWWPHFSSLAGQVRMYLPRGDIQCVECLLHFNVQCYLLLNLFLHPWYRAYSDGQDTVGAHYAQVSSVSCKYVLSTRTPRAKTRLPPCGRTIQMSRAAPRFGPIGMDALAGGEASPGLTTYLPRCSRCPRIEPKTCNALSEALASRYPREFV